MITKINPLLSNKKLLGWSISIKKILKAQMLYLFKKSSKSHNNINKVWNKPINNTIILPKNSKSNNNKEITLCYKLKIVLISFKGCKLKSKLKSYNSNKNSNNKVKKLKTNKVPLNHNKKIPLNNKSNLNIKINDLHIDIHMNFTLL